MTVPAADPALRRFERDAVLACILLACVTFLAVVAAGRLGLAFSMAGGVLGGGALMAASYRAIKGAADLLVALVGAQHAVPLPEPAPVLSPARRAFLAVKFFTRYALLAVAAYVMLTCFRLHPVGVLAGATSPFLAALMQVARMSRARRTHP